MPEAAIENTHSAPELSVAEKPTVELEKCVFTEGEWAGFKFYSPKFNDFNAMREHFGEQNILNMINTQVSARLRTKVKNGLPKNLKGAELDAFRKARLTNNPEGILLSESEALNWRPDIREESTNTIFKDIKECIKNGDLSKITSELFPKFLEAMQREGGGNIDIASLFQAATRR